MRALLKQFWFQSLAIVLVAAVAIWFLGPAWVHDGHRPLEPEFNRLLGILVIVVCWGLNNLRLQLVGRRDERELLAGILGHDEHSAAPESANRVSLERRLRRAIELMESRAGFRGRYLRSVPWFAFIGPPGAGKSTAVANCNIRFETADGPADAALRGVGGTRDCEWWFSKEALLLDTAGRYTVHEQGGRDHREWLDFIDLIKRHRPGRALNGIIVVISVQDLLTLRVNQRNAHAHAIRQRLRELHRRLGIKLPVYVLLTKADLVAGFRETFADFTQSERQEPWGMTLPMDPAVAKLGGPVEVLCREFDDMVERLGRRAFAALARETDPRKRSLIFRFPPQVGALQAPLRQILGHVFPPGSSGPILRGLYFSSGTQRGAPIDQLLGRVARNFGFGYDPAMRLLPSRKSFFLSGLFRDIIFREAGLGAWLERDRNWNQRRAFSLGVVAAVTLFGLLSIGLLARDASRVFEHFELASSAARAPAGTAGELDQAWHLHAAQEQVGRLARGGPLMLFGPMLQLAEPAGQISQSLLEQRVIPDLARRAKRVVGNESDDVSKRALLAYRMLTRGEQGLDQDFLRAWLAGDAAPLGYTEQQARRIADLVAVASVGADRREPTRPDALRSSVAQE